MKAVLGGRLCNAPYWNPNRFNQLLNRAWRSVGTVPNTTVYVIWLSLESIAAVGFLGLLAYSAIVFAAARLR